MAESAQPVDEDGKPRPLTATEIAALQHIYLGPTWQKTRRQKYRLPKRTLGWQIAGWCTHWLRFGEGQAWKFTDEQLRFLLWWYALDEDGEFTDRKGVLQRLKGWGKDPLLAVICLVEWVGPSRLDYFDDDAPGGAVGRPHPDAWVQIAAVSKDQTKNTARMFPSLISDEMKLEYGMDLGAELFKANGGRCTMETVTSNYRSLEGGRSTFVVLNETHHWVEGNQGIQMWLTVDGNTTKLSSRYLAITNAYLPGEDSVAQKMRESYDKQMAGFARRTKFLYDSIEAHPETPLTPEALEIVIPIIRGDAVWLKPADIIDSISESAMPVSRSKRMWLNQIVSLDDALYSPADWEPLGEGFNPETDGLKPGDEIALGFDGGKSDDGTAIVALRIRDSRAFILGYWERPYELPAKQKWEINREAVDAKIHETFAAYKVVAFYADVAYWESYLLEWERVYGDTLAVKSTDHRPISWDMRQALQRVTRAHERLIQTILDRKIRHDGDPRFRIHVLNVYRRDNQYGVHFGKASRESSRKIDIYAALFLAHEAMSDYHARGKKQKQRTGRGYFL